MLKTHHIKRNMLCASVAFALTIGVVTEADAMINFNAGAGIVLMGTESAADDTLSEIMTDVETAAPTKAADKAAATATPAQTEDAQASVQVSEDVKPADQSSSAPKSESEDSAVVVDMAEVSGNSVASGNVAGSDEIPALTVGAGSVIPDNSILTEEEMEDEFAEEEAAGGAFGYTHLGVVQVDDHLNVRAGAEEDSKIVGKMEKDAGCEILDVKGNMAHITSGSVEGYVNLDYLITGPEAVEYASNAIKETATVNCDGLKLREDKSTEAPVYSMVAYGEQLEVVEKTDEWIGVKYDGRVLYVSADYVTVGTQLKTALNMTEFLYGSGVSDVRMDLCEYAKKFVGNPYVWGGVSLTKGADCSGFVLSVYAKYGISLPHSSRAQANCGTRISMSEARPGDLVFYAKGSRINHVGIYIGGGQIVNASSPKTGIRIANAYYRKPVAVVRILQD